MEQHKLKAMQAIFDLTEAIMEGNLSIIDLTEIVTRSVEGGHGIMEICLSMTLRAVEAARENSQGGSNKRFHHNE